MNYRHAYHAGNFADVLKHVTLLLCLEHLKRKDAAFRVIDTHAGAGRYWLDQVEAEKTGEWQDGIGRLIGPAAQPIPAAAAEILQPYLAAIQAENTQPTITIYPGSPMLAQRILRAGDALVANELQPEQAKVLAASLGRDKLCKVSSLDGYTALKALLPPKERRGLVLIDPPFEEPGELVRMTEALAAALKRFATGIYLLWYPIKDEKPVARFHRGVLEAAEAAKLPPPLKIELLLRPVRNPTLLNGAGLIVVNPPYTLGQTLATLMPFLANRLGHEGSGSFNLGPLGAQPPRTRLSIAPSKSKTLIGK